MTETAIPRVLIIAGSDSGGGAGIQADIKTVTMLGGFAMTAVTAITAQNTLGVHGIWPVPVNGVSAQLRAVLTDLGCDAIKTGMLASAELIETVAGDLDAHAQKHPRVVDPVMVATSGDRLIDEKAVGALMSELVRGATLVTPNAPEAEILTGKAVETVDGQRRAAEALLEAGADAALVKGGHIDGTDITDVLQTQHGEWLLPVSRVETTSTHGTGCTLASAIATRLGHGDAMESAVQAAQTYVHEAITHAPGFGGGHGPLAHNWQLDVSEGDK